jgi:pimeloyl-ACP methyl ester carboxylesterase
VVALAAATLTAAGSATAAPATPAPAAIPARGADTTASTITWGACTSTVLKQAKAQCAMLSVPLDYTKPSGTKIRLALSRVRHTVAAAKYQGVMLVNPGGPGGSGLTLSLLGPLVPKQAGNAYDWIGFDPRGVGSSRPKVSCDPRYFNFNRPKYEPTSAAIERAWKAKTNAYTTKCAKKNGAILRHLTTVENAQDMERIRKALGVKTINYYGFSYGTYLGQVYATKYPQRLRRVVFDGTVDPRDVWYKANLNQDTAFDRNMNIWFGWIAKHDSTYHLGKTEAAVRKVFYATKAKLQSKPAQGRAGKLGGSEWADSFLYAGYYQVTWPDLASVFSGYVRSGAVAPLESAYLDANGYGDDNGYAIYLGVQCTDVAWPKSWATWKRDNDRVYKKAPFYTWGNAWYNEPCRHWPAPSRQPVQVTGAKVPSLLMINETLDAATPYPGSIEVRKRFPKARLIAEPGGTTHSGSLNGNACVDNRIADYLLTGALPKRVAGNRADVSCKPLPQPKPGEVAALGAGTAANLRLELQKLSARP